MRVSFAMAANYSGLTPSDRDHVNLGLALCKLLPIETVERCSTPEDKLVLSRQLPLMMTELQDGQMV